MESSSKSSQFMMIKRRLGPFKPKPPNRKWSNRIKSNLNCERIIDDVEWDFRIKNLWLCMSRVCFAAECIPFYTLFIIDAFKRNASVIPNKFRFEWNIYVLKISVLCWFQIEKTHVFCGLSDFWICCDKSEKWIKESPRGHSDPWASCVWGIIANLED